LAQDQPTQIGLVVEGKAELFAMGIRRLKAGHAACVALPRCTPE
jgi:hypothetical protein